MSREAAEEYRARLLAYQPKGQHGRIQGVRWAELEEHHGLFSLRIGVMNHWWPSKEDILATPSNVWVLVVDDTGNDKRWSNHHRVGQWLFRWDMHNLNRIRFGRSPLLLDPDTDEMIKEDPEWALDIDRIDELDFIPEKHDW